MKKSHLFFFAFLYLIFFHQASLAQTTHYAQKSVLMIGNSFSRDAARYLPKLAKAGNHNLVLTRAEMPGSSLQRHWDSVAVNLKDRTRGLAYNGKSLKHILESQKYDVISIQQASILSGDSLTYFPYANELYAFIRKYQPEAQIVIHETWPYRSDSKSFGRIALDKFAKTQEDMYDHLKESYKHLAQKLDAPIVSTGDAFYAVAKNPIWHFKKDALFDAKKAIKPQLPKEQNSLNVGYYWNNKDKLIFDTHHASQAGCYLAGLVWYTFLFNDDPTTLKFKPDGVNENFATFLKETAKSVVLNK